jgi:drug/metabolite transporter (DMT)-like permease
LYPIYESIQLSITTKARRFEQQIQSGFLKQSWGNWLIFLALSLVWGSSFILMKEGLRVLDAYQVASIRILSAGLVLLPFLPQSLRAVPRKKLGTVLLSGLMGTFFPAYLFCLAETKLDSALAGILNALTPLFTLSMGAMFFHVQIGWRKWTGVVIGFLGMILLMLAGRQTVDISYLGFASFILLATIFYGINVNTVNRFLSDIGSLHIATLAFTFLILPASAILAATGFFGSAHDTSAWLRAVGASAVLGILGTALASILFYVLLKKAGPVFSSMVTYGIPFVALGWGVLAGETVNMLQLLCLLLILAGVYIAKK